EEGGTARHPRRRSAGSAGVHRHTRTHTHPAVTAGVGASGTSWFAPQRCGRTSGSPRPPSPAAALTIIRKALTEEKQVSTKTSAADLVTETDHFVENLIISALKEKFPSHRFIAEESTAAGSKCVLTDSPTWIIDPVDGTCNFVHRFPTVAVSIGFAVNKELEFGVIYHCTEERLYTGRRGQGAFCNDKRLQVSKETDISKALILTEIGPKRDPATLKLFLGNIERLLKAQAHGVRVIGSSTLALCHLASGAADAYYQFGLHCWDLAAATVIIREAGGTVIDTSGGPLDLMSCRVIAAGTREMAMVIAQEIQTIHYRRDDEN
uniref:Inositol-1-monophosphatase n=1 Tax=Dromaius novaehollandiae TaxID=8790 RepID=A0A8C4JVC7_DRONO